MAMTKPIGLAVVAYDATTANTVNFTTSGGNQVVKNRIVVKNNVTNVTVFDNTVVSFKFEHIIPANTLANNTYYNYSIQTFDVSDNASELSAPIQFYCYTAPTLLITNMPIGNEIEASSYTFQATYNQIEGELLNTCSFTLYDKDGLVISSSGNMYNSATPPLNFSYTFNGFENNGTYKVSVDAVSVNGTVSTTGLITFTTTYFYPNLFSLLDLSNNCSKGYIEIINNMVVIDGITNPTPPTYISGTKIDLRADDSWVKWIDGFNIAGDFTLGLWFNDANDISRLCTLWNSADSTLTPNRIEINYTQGYDYGSSTLQKFVELSCYNNFTLPYYAYSNYIDAPLDSDNLFLWIRKIDGIFTVKLENLS